MLLVFTAWLPNAKDGADKTAGYTPVPLNCTVCGEVEESSFTLRVPVVAPKAVGLKVTEILQLAPDASVFGHFVLSPKAPETETLLIVRASACVLLRVTVSALLVVFTTNAPNVTVVGLRV